jgi:hypothetical protein
MTALFVSHLLPVVQHAGCSVNTPTLWSNIEHIKATTCAVPLGSRNKPLTYVNHPCPDQSDSQLAVRVMSGEDGTNWRLHELMEQAVEAGLLDAGSRGHEITQQVIHERYESLFPAQRQVFIAEALPALNEMMRRQFVRECSDNDNAPGRVVPGAPLGAWIAAAGEPSCVCCGRGDVNPATNR